MHVENGYIWVNFFSSVNDDAHIVLVHKCDTPSAMSDLRHIPYVM